MAFVALFSGWSHGQAPAVGVLRLSWKTVGEKILIEMAEVGDDVPAHMRPQQEFEEKMRDYKLTATIDGEPWLDQVMRPPGLHRDRPISVFEEREVPPGSYRVQVRFWPVQAEGAKWKPEIDTVVVVKAGEIATLTVTPAGEQLK